MTERKVVFVLCLILIAMMIAGCNSLRGQPQICIFAVCQAPVPQK